jgi:tRNA(Leu) C34 or U34 (ribose-2'-O)-methylase TrmL
MQRRSSNPERDEARSEPVDLVYGLRAGLAVFTLRPADIVRVACSRALRHETADLSRWAAARGVPISERSDADLALLAEADQHEGLVMQVKPRPWASPRDLAARLVSRRGVAIALDRVRNPYNTGAILRSAAFFGADAAILGAQAPHPALSPQAVRVAEGGAEHLTIARTTDLAETLALVRASGVRVVGADGTAELDARDAKLRGPIVVVLGNEREGLSLRVRSQCDQLIALRGAGAVESLNVAVAAGVLIAEVLRSKKSG